MRVKWVLTAVITATVVMAGVGLGIGINKAIPAQSSLNCQACHGDTHAKWTGSPHANTQTDVAVELAVARAGQTPDEVLHGKDAEDCIACHSPTAIAVNGGMSEAQALSYFFTTSDGKFTKDTAAAHTADWPHVACTTCHNVPSNHPPSMPALALFNSQAGQYVSVDGASKLCGQCHGDLHFAGSDHQTYNAWTTSRHSQTQADVASEFSKERVGQTPDEVLHGKDAEDCIACHAPTAVLANGGMSEAQALSYFFSTSDGKFTGNTAAAHSPEWPSVACTACHDQHDPAKPSYFNASTKKYEPMKSANELCGQCHGDLRFPDTNHLSYNIESGTGGVGVPDKQMMPGVSCTDCHMFVSNVDGSNSAMFQGHSWAISVQEGNGQTTTSCTHCHADLDTAKANATITGWKSDFQALAATAENNVAAAADAMKAVTDKPLQAKLDEAQRNLKYAESDESGGSHNHKYLMALLNDANDRALEILAALKK